jgi:hypothetical protein
MFWSYMGELLPILGPSNRVIGTTDKQQATIQYMLPTAPCAAIHTARRMTRVDVCRCCLKRCCYCAWSSTRV